MSSREGEERLWGGGRRECEREGGEESRSVSALTILSLGAPKPFLLSIGCRLFSSAHGNQRLGQVPPAILGVTRWLTSIPSAAFWGPLKKVQISKIRNSTKKGRLMKRLV